MAYYAVWRGHNTGVFTNWGECSKQVTGFSGALYKKLNAKTKSEAEQEFKKGHPSGSTNKSSGSMKTKDKKRKEHKIQNYHLKPGIHVFVDGSCFKNPAPSASGAAVFANGVLMKAYYGRYIQNGSNNISELEAALFYLKKIKDINRPVSLYIDSDYTIKCFTTWGFNWEKRGWKKSDGKPVENLELVQKCLEAYKEVKHLVTVIKVKSHIGEPGNEVADYLAKQALINKVMDWSECDHTTNIEKIIRTGSL